MDPEKNTIFSVLAIGAGGFCYLTKPTDESLRKMISDKSNEDAVNATGIQEYIGKKLLYGAAKTTLNYTFYNYVFWKQPPSVRRIRGNDWILQPVDRSQYVYTSILYTLKHESRS